MPELKITVGERSYEVACQPGEELHLQSAAAMLDGEASVVLKASPKVTEAQLLLMAGLMLADKMASGAENGALPDGQSEELRQKLAASEARCAELRTALTAAQAAQPAQSGAEVALLEKMASELERLADEMEAASS